MSARVTLRCNDCDARCAEADTAREARAMAYTVGWRHWSRGVDLCRGCAEVRREKKAQESTGGYF